MRIIVEYGNGIYDAMNCIMSIYLTIKTECIGVSYHAFSICPVRTENFKIIEIVKQFGLIIAN